MNCGVGVRRDSYSALLWLGGGGGGPVELSPHAGEPPYAGGPAQKKKKKTRKKKKKKKNSGQRDVKGAFPPLKRIALHQELESLIVCVRT